MYKVDIYIGDIIDLCNCDEKQEEYLKELSVFRREKALRMKFRSGKALSIGAGILLKNALEKYSIEEKKVTYGFSENGKPYLLEYPDIHFNLSHSHDKVMCVCSKGINSGCDVEKIRTGRRNIAERFFTEYENEMIASSTDPDEMFFKLWTLKESFIKCTGEGLGRAMNSFEFYYCKDDEFKIRFVNDKTIFCNQIEVKKERNYKFLSGYDIFNTASKSYMYSICYEVDKNLNEEDIILVKHNMSI